MSTLFTEPLPVEAASGSEGVFLTVGSPFNMLMQHPSTALPALSSSVGGRATRSRPHKPRSPSGSTSPHTHRESKPVSESGSIEPSEPSEHHSLKAQTSPPPSPAALSVSKQASSRSQSTAKESPNGTGPTGNVNDGAFGGKSPGGRSRGSGTQAEGLDDPTSDIRCEYTGRPICRFVVHVFSDRALSSCA